MKPKQMKTVKKELKWIVSRKLEGRGHMDVFEEWLDRFIGTNRLNKSILKGRDQTMLKSFTIGYIMGYEQRGGEKDNENQEQDSEVREGDRDKEDNKI